MLSRPVVLLAAVALLAAACTDSPAEPPVPAPGGPPPMPPPAAQNTEQGATSFASHWLDLVDYGYRTLDAGPLRGLADPTCRACSEFVAQLDRDRAAGLRYQGGAIHFRSAVPTGTQAGKSTVTVLFDQDELKVLGGVAAAVETVPANRTIFVFELHWVRDGWRAAAVKLGMENGEPPN
jgi:hypothetical protein